MPRWPSLRRDRPDGLRHLPLTRGERVMAHASEESTGLLVVATNHRVAVLDERAEDSGIVLDRAWHEVSEGSWDRESRTMTITWADGSAPVRLVLEQADVLLAVLRERIQASVIAVQEVTVATGVKVRLALRQELAGGRVIEQVQARRPHQLREPDVAAAVRDRLRAMREEIGR